MTDTLRAGWSSYNIVAVFEDLEAASAVLHALDMEGFEPAVYLLGPQGVPGRGLDETSGIQRTPAWTMTLEPAPDGSVAVGIHAPDADTIDRASAILDEGAPIEVAMFGADGSIAS